MNRFIVIDDAMRFVLWFFDHESTLSRSPWENNHAFGRRNKTVVNLTITGTTASARSMTEPWMLVFSVPGACDPGQRGNQYVLVRGSDITEQERHNSLLTDCSRRQQNSGVGGGQELHLRPGLACHSRVVIHFLHPKDAENAKPCLRILRRRRLQIMPKPRNLRWIAFDDSLRAGIPLTRA